LKREVPLVSFSSSELSKLGSGFIEADAHMCRHSISVMMRLQTVNYIYLFTDLQKCFGMSTINTPDSMRYNRCMHESSNPRLHIWM
jgi:hypothetical protein